MASRSKKTAPASEMPQLLPGQKLRADLPATDAKEQAYAALANRPSANGAAVIEKFCPQIFGARAIGALADSLEESIQRLKQGDMSDVEAMLISQAHALQSMFVHMSRRVLLQEYQKNAESFFRMALKAQSQCRMTLETLAAVKNPPVVFVKQANIAHGPQQVNNGPEASPDCSREEKTLQSNELLETPHE